MIDWWLSRVRVWGNGVRENAMKAMGRGGNQSNSNRETREILEKKERTTNTDFGHTRILPEIAFIPCG